MSGSSIVLISLSMPRSSFVSFISSPETMSTTSLCDITNVWRQTNIEIPNWGEPLLSCWVLWGHLLAWLPGKARCLREMASHQLDISSPGRFKTVPRLMSASRLIPGWWQILGWRAKGRLREVNDSLNVEGSRQPPIKTSKEKRWKGKKGH